MSRFKKNIFAFSYHISGVLTRWLSDLHCRLQTANPQLVSLIAVVAGVIGVSYAGSTSRAGLYLPHKLPFVGMSQIFFCCLLLSVVTSLVFANDAMQKHKLRWIVGMVALGGVLCLMRIAQIDQSRPIISGKPVTLEVTVLQLPAQRRFQVQTAQARITRGVSQGQRILLRIPRQLHRVPLRVGNKLDVAGSFESLNHYEYAARSAGVGVQFAVQRMTARGMRGGFFGIADRLRSGIETRFKEHLSPTDAALADGMLLGQASQLTPHTVQTFRDTGLTHLVAASGANIVLLVVVVFTLTTVLSVPFAVRILVALMMVCMYVPLAGGGPSIQRAALSGIVMLIALAFGRPLLRWYALAVAAFVTAIYNPWIIHDLGWQLSFVSVIGIFLGTNPISQGVNKYMKLPYWLTSPVAVTLAATLATAPLIANTFGYFSPIGVVANLLVIPAVPVVMWGSVLFLTATLLLPELVPVSVMVLKLALQWVLFVAKQCAEVPFATLPFSFPHTLLLLCFLGALFVCFKVSGRHRFFVVTVLVMIAAISLPLPALISHSVPNGFRVSFLAIGQGDSTLIQHGTKTVLVDTGPPDGPVIRELKNAGVKKIDLLVLTHPSADHEGAAEVILRTFPVGAILDGGAVAEAPPTNGLRKAYRFAASHHLKRVAPAAGLQIAVGPISLKVLWPRGKAPYRSATADANDRATVLYIRDGSFRMLLPADAESNVTGQLALPHVDVLKVAHHGSADPDLPIILRRLRPRIAVIPVGLHNRYGHPAPSTLQALKAVPVVKRTDLNGTVRIVR